MRDLSRPISCPELRSGTRVNRRDFLRIGSVGFSTAGLFHLLSHRSGATPPRRAPSARACIVLFQVGAPDEVRGPYRPTATRVPGIHVTEALPRLAQLTDKFAIVRSVHHTIRCHNPAIYCSLVGREATDPMAVSNRTNARRTDHPHYASVVTRMRRGIPAMPHHVIIPNVVFNGPARSPGLMAGYLGATYDPMVLGSDPNSADFRVDGTGLPDDIPPARFSTRQTLLQRIDAQHREIDNARSIETMSTFYRRATALLTSPQAKSAFDIDQEPVTVRDRYGRNTMGQGALLARRLVQAGVPFVTVFSHTRVERDSWDTHNQHYQRSQTLLPAADQSLSALLEDLSARGLLDDVLVVWMGEFGRTPRMGVNFSNNTNNVGGRDHWCNCYSVVLAGGGVRGGQVVGASDWMGAYPTRRPVHISDLAATIYHALGVDPREQIYDIQGQLHSICDGSVVGELF